MSGPEGFEVPDVVSYLQPFDPPADDIDPAIRYFTLDETGARVPVYW